MITLKDVFSNLLTNKTIKINNLILENGGRLEVVCCDKITSLRMKETCLNKYSDYVVRSIVDLNTGIDKLDSVIEITIIRRGVL